METVVARPLHIERGTRQPRRPPTTDVCLEPGSARNAAKFPGAGRFQNGLANALIEAVWQDAIGDLTLGVRLQIMAGPDKFVEFVHDHPRWQFVQAQVTFDWEGDFESRIAATGLGVGDRRNSD